MRSMPCVRAIFCICIALFQLAPAAREPWTTSRVLGSPDAPPPYELKALYPRMEYKEPVEICMAPGLDRIFIEELSGKISSFKPSAPARDELIDLRKLHPEMESAYGMVFDPGFQTNRYLYVCYALKQGTEDGTKVVRFTLSKTDPPALLPDSEKLLITWLAGGHNGGCLKFGPDGFLYISTGDAAAPNPPDPLDTGQDNSDLLSSILRIDVHATDPGKNYRTPPDNPFVGQKGVRPEIWAFGFRNPWKFSFDSETGFLWAGDVGWELWELVFKVDKGGNYGWSIMEGSQPIKTSGKRGPGPIIPPVLQLPHSEGASVTGGLVYHGAKHPELQGAYIFGDWVTGKIWGLRYESGKLTWHKELASTGRQIIAFGEDSSRELLVLDYAGGINELTRSPAPKYPPENFPGTLAKTGLFADVRRHELAPGVIPFEINVPAWADNARAARFIALPGQNVIEITNASNFKFPTNTVLGRTFTLPASGGDPRKVETQILHYDGLSWHGYSYKWRDDQSDADLVGADGEERSLTGLPQNWHYPSRAECLRCHNSWVNFAISFNFAQLDTPSGQLSEFVKYGLLPKAPIEKIERLPNPFDHTTPLADRARSYLHVNCSHCHRDGAGGSVPLQMVYGIKMEDLKLVNVVPNQGTFGLKNPHIITPGQPCSSTLYYRINTTGPGRMPRIGSYEVDKAGVALLHDWIKSLGSAPEESPSEHWTKSTSEALAMVRQIDSGSLKSSERQAAIERGTRSENPQVRDLFERFLPAAERTARLGANINPAQILAIAADAKRGKEIFFGDAGPQCKRCHQIAGVGTDFAPDLSQLSKKMGKAQILENILFPSKQIDPAFITYQLETTDDLSYSGILLKKTEDQIVFKDQTAKIVTVPTARVRRLEAQQLSAMPESLLQGLTPQQVADLLEFLATPR